MEFVLVVLERNGLDDLAIQERDQRLSRGGNRKTDECNSDQVQVWDQKDQNVVQRRLGNLLLFRLGPALAVGPSAEPI